MHRFDAFPHQHRAQGLITGRAVEDTRLCSGLLYIFNILPLDFSGSPAAPFSSLSLDSPGAAKSILINVLPLHALNPNKFKDIPDKMMFVRRQARRTGSLIGYF
jgi:hypothetical protein